MTDGTIFIGLSLVLLAGAIYLYYSRRSLQHRYERLQVQIDSQHALNEIVRRDEQLLRNLLDHAPGPMALKDREANFLIVNRHFADIHGRTPDEVVGLNVRDLYPPEKTAFFLEKDRALLASGEVSYNEVEAVDGDGEKVVFLTQRFPVRDDDGVISAIGTTNTNITGLKETEAELTRYRDYLEDLVAERTRELAELNDQKDKFFSIIAHDLRGPFNALLGFTRLLNTDASKFNQAQIVEMSGSINEAAEVLSTLLENLLEWSRLQMDGIEVAAGPVDLKDLIDRNLELFRPVAEAKNISISGTAGAASVVSADTDMVDAILRNLINNALKFTPAGGRVSIGVNAVEDGIHTEVADTGVGISAEDMNDLFRLDRKTSRTGTAGETGTGLGLQLCKELAEKQNGELRVESRTDNGTTITFTLPKWREQSGPTSP